MPARRLRLKCSHVFTLIAVVFLLPAVVHGQAGRASVTLTGKVSEIVALSIPPNFTGSEISASVVGNASNVRLTLSSKDADASVIRVPLFVRSNSGFKISAAFESETAVLNQLAVTDVRATGKWVSPHVVSAFDTTLDVSQSVLVLSGPRISLGGALDSPNNALQMTLLIRLQPQSGSGWLAHLTFVATPE
jgi:hypothetical protein